MGNYRRSRTSGNEKVTAPITFVVTLSDYLGNATELAQCARLVDAGNLAGLVAGNRRPENETAVYVSVECERSGRRLLLATHYIPTPGEIDAWLSPPESNAGKRSALDVLFDPA